jgi:asparagine synthase (glutamine-hydrolysing)
MNIFKPEFRETLDSSNVFQEFYTLSSNLPSDCDRLRSIFLTDIKITLPKTFLEKVDKSTMANSVEIRVPLLDKELVEFALSLPSNLKLKNGEQKYILRQALRGTIPDKVLDRSKTGFGVPYSYWLAKTLRSFFLDNISSSQASSILDVPKILTMLDMHEQGKGNYGFLLWKTLNLAIWINQSSPNFSLRD